MRILQKGTIQSINEVLGEFRADNKSMSSNTDLLFNNLSSVVENHILALSLPPQKQRCFLRKYLSRIEYYKGRTFQKTGHYMKAIPILLHSIKSDPFDVKKWISLLLSFLHSSL